MTCQNGTPNCTNGSMGFSAGTGYDQVTGLGSVNVANLVNEWVNVWTSPNPLAFGTRLPNTSTTLPVKLQNNNGVSLGITGIAISGGFSQTNNCPSTLNFGASCTINVTFLSASAGQQSGTLTIMASDSANPHQVPISGTGGDIAMTLSRVSRVVRSDANLAPATGTVQPATTTSTPTAVGSQLTAAATTRVVTAAGVEASLSVSPARLSVIPTGTVTVTNHEATRMVVAIEVPSGFSEDNDCGEQLDAGASCSIKLTRKHAGASGELKISTPAGTTSVPIE